MKKNVFNYSELHFSEGTSFKIHTLNCSANPAHLPQNWAKLAKLAVLVVGGSKTAPRILIFSIVLSAEYSFHVKSIATYAPQKIDIITHS